MARTPFKLKSGNSMAGSSFKMMGSSSPAKSLGNWITGDDGIPVQVSKRDYIKHEKKGGKLLKERSDAEVYDNEGKLVADPMAGESLAHEFIKGNPSNELGISNARRSTTGLESIDALREDWKSQGGIINSGKYEGTKAKNFMDWATQSHGKELSKYQQEAKEEEKSGVAEKQDVLNQASREADE